MKTFTPHSLCSATSYMAAMLRDGGDLDSADRSMLDSESVHERMFRSVMIIMEHNAVDVSLILGVFCHP